MSDPLRPHPLVRRLSAATRRAIDRGCTSVRRVVRNPMPLADQASAWLRGSGDDAGEDAALRDARRREAVTLLGLSEVDRAAQACSESIGTLEDEMEANVDAVVPLRDTIGKLSATRSELETERSRLLAEHRHRKAERVALEKSLADAAPRPTPPSRPSTVVGAFDAAGEKVTDLMDAMTDAVGRRLPFVRR